MSKRKKQRKDTVTITENVSKLIKKLGLTDQDVKELNDYISEDINRDIDESILKILSDENITKNKMIFLAYMRGILESRYYIDNRYVDENDAVNKMSEGFHGWDIEHMLDRIVPIFHTLIISCIDDPDDLSMYLETMSGYFKMASENAKNRDKKVIEMMDTIRNCRN
jgi:hypothetical protein